MTIRPTRITAGPRSPIEPVLEPLATLHREVYPKADVAIVTTDHPRSESPSEIVTAVVAGFSRHERVEIEIDDETGKPQLRIVRGARRKE